MANETVQPKHVGKDQYEAGIVDCEPEQFASSWGKQVPLAPKKVGSFMLIEHKEEPKKPKKVFVILNPHGGFGQGKKAWESVAPVFEKAGIECVVQRTEFGGHATQLAKSLPLEQYDAILAIGGDGTIHEIINGLLNREDKKTIPLGLIPGGTGNSVLTSMEVDSPAYAAEAIINGHIVNIDLAKCTWAEDAGPKSCYSINMMGWGLAADCNATAEKLRIFGNQRYNVGIVWEILKSTDRLIRLEIDDEIIERNFTLAMILNNQHAGKDLNIAPFAKLDDGLLDLVLLDKFGRSKTLAAFGDLQKSTHIYRHDGVEYRRVRKVTFHTQTRDEITIDGENCAHTPITVEVVPAVLPIFFHPPAVHAERQAAKS